MGAIEGSNVKKFLMLVVSTTLILCDVSALFAQKYPDRPITLIIPFLLTVLKKRINLSLIDRTK